MKRGESILLKEDFYKEHEQEIMLGLTDDVVNAKGGCNIGKRLAYNGLLLSTSFIPNDYQLTLDDCLIVPDFETIINEKVECIDHDDNSITNISIRNEDIKIPQTDGAGMFLPGVLPYSCQIRCGHIKGCVFPLDFRKFLQLGEVEVCNEHAATQRRGAGRGNLCLARPCEAVSERGRFPRPAPRGR